MANELQIFKGNDKTFLLTIAGAPGDTSGWTITVTVKKKIGDAVAVITLTNGVQVVNLTATTWNILFIPSDTDDDSGIKAGPYFYDVKGFSDDPTPLEFTLASTTIQIDATPNSAATP